MAGCTRLLRREICTGHPSSVEFVGQWKTAIKLIDSIDLTTGLYGESFISSVSRIESYYSCPFQHYASFGLGLQERSEYTLEAPAIGDLFHAALKWVSDETMRLRKVLGRINKRRMLVIGNRCSG